MRFLVDEEVRVSIGAKKNWVHVSIGAEHDPDQSLNLEPEEARALAEALENAAKEAELRGKA